MGIEENNKELIQRLFELYSQHDLDAADAFYAEGCFPDMTWEQNRQFDTMMLNAFPDLKITLLDMIAEGDKVAFINSITGTHTGGPFWGIPPTGKRVEGINTRIVRIVDNKITEFRGTTDIFGSLRQLGVLPSIPEIVKAHKDSLK